MRLLPLLPMILAAACGGKIENPGDGDGSVPQQPPGVCKFTQPTQSGGCNTMVTIEGDPAACGVEGASKLQDPAVCQKLCNGNSTCETTGSANEITCGLMGCLGRRPEGLAPLDAPSSIGEYFGCMAALEAASVDAFLRLEMELEAHGAPTDLRVRARRAMRDEKRHARMAGGLARRFGARAKAPSIALVERRSLEAIAIENAVEGCIRETWGAVSGAWQSRASTDPVVRAVMDRLHVDEIRHAELSWAVHDWAMEKLDGAARERVRAAMRDAAAELRRETSIEPSDALARAAGLPRRHEAHALLDALDRHVWATA